MSASEEVGCFAFGALVTVLCFVVYFAKTKDTLELHELYRFCLVKNIPLDECRIPPKPYINTPKEAKEDELAKR